MMYIFYVKLLKFRDKSNQNNPLELRETGKFPRDGRGHFFYTAHRMRAERLVA